MTKLRDKNFDKKVFLLVTPQWNKRAVMEGWIRKHFQNPTIYMAVDGVDALTKIENDPPHVVITDLDLPRLSGHKLISELLPKREHKTMSWIIADHPPEKEAFLDEVVTGRIQFLENIKDEAEFARHLAKALNYVSFGEKSSFHVRFLSKGDLLLKEGEKGDCVFIVKKGTLRAFHLKDGAKLELGEIGPGEFVGEMAYINGEPRNAHVESISDSELIEIPFGSFEHVLFKRPAWSKTLMTTLCKRLKHANQKELASKGEPNS